MENISGIISILIFCHKREHRLDQHMSVTLIIRCLYPDCKTASLKFFSASNDRNWNRFSFLKAEKTHFNQQKLSFLYRLNLDALHSGGGGLSSVTLTPLRILFSVSP